MKITLDKITLKNFKGIKELSIDLNGRNADISGKNASGKSTIIDSFMWLLFDKDSQDKKDFNIKFIDESGEVIHGLEHSVTCTLSIDGTSLELQKVYYEKWTKQKGSAEKVFTGHTTDYFIDGVPIQKKEYTDKISSIVDEGTFKLLTNPLYFNDQLHWSKRRELLFQVCGDISDGEVIDRFATLDNKDAVLLLTNILNAHSLDDYKKIIASKKKKVNEELEKIPVRINEVVLGKPDLKEINFSAVASNLSNLQKDNEKHRNTIVQLQNSGGVADKERRIAEIDTEVYKLSSNAKREQEEALRGIERDISTKVFDISQAERQYRSINITRLQMDLELANKLVESSRAEFIKVRDKEFEFSQESVCPTCGQGIPESELEEVREKALEKFNQEKSVNLESIRAKGKEMAATAKEIQGESEQAKTELQVTEESIKNLKLEKEALEIKLKEVKETLVDYTQTDEYKNLTIEKTKLQETIQSIKGGAKEEILKVQQTIRGNEEAMKLMQGTLAKEEQAKTADSRIESLKQDEKRLAKEYAQLEKEQYLIEEFIRTKVSLVESSINTRFKMVRFKLFNEQVNGSLDETCETLINSNGSWVPWTDANTGGRVNSGIDIINTLSAHYETSAPMFIDNAEAVTEIIKTESQTIKLLVPPSWKRLSADIKQSMIEKYGEKAEEIYTKQCENLKVEVN